MATMTKEKALEIAKLTLDNQDKKMNADNNYPDNEYNKRLRLSGIPVLEEGVCIWVWAVGNKIIQFYGIGPITNI